MTRARLRNALIGLDVFIGIGAVLGGIAMLIEPDGSLVALSLDWLGGSPFSDYTVPGVLLIVVIGLPFLVAAVALIARIGPAAPVSLLAGALLVGWIAVQIALIGYETRMQPLTAAFGVATVLLAGALMWAPAATGGAADGGTAPPSGRAHPA